MKNSRRFFAVLAGILIAAAIIIPIGRTCLFKDSNSGETRPGVTAAENLSGPRETAGEHTADGPLETAGEHTADGLQETTGEHTAASPQEPAAGGAEIRYTFRRDEYLTEHFEKHGDEFGYATEEEYLAGANSVIMDKASLHKLEAEDGDDVYFQESTGGLVIVSADGYIRTYFKPDSGIDYYNRQ